MTNEQKEQIKMLRDSGYGYATIAEALGLTKNQVSAFCHRNNLSGNAERGLLPLLRKAPRAGLRQERGKVLL